jgi:hypothetical protein
MRIRSQPTMKKPLTGNVIHSDGSCFLHVVCVYDEQRLTLLTLDSSDSLLDVTRDENGHAVTQQPRSKLGVCPFYYSTLEKPASRETSSPSRPCGGSRNHVSNSQYYICKSSPMWKLDKTQDKTTFKVERIIYRVHQSGYFVHCYSIRSSVGEIRPTTQKSSNLPSR